MSAPGFVSAIAIIIVFIGASLLREKKYGINEEHFVAAAFFPNGDRFISKINGVGGGEMLLFQAKEGFFRIFCGDAAF